MNSLMACQPMPEVTDLWSRADTSSCPCALDSHRVLVTTNAHNIDWHLSWLLEVAMHVQELAAEQMTALAASAKACPELDQVRYQICGLCSTEFQSKQIVD